MPASTNKSIAVVGGGLTGLTAAWRLHRSGHRVTVFEKAGQAGGAIITTQKAGWLIEGGPNSMQETAEVAALINEIGLSDQRVPASPVTKKRFIVRGGRLLPVPLSPAGLLTTPLFSLSTRLRVFKELTMQPHLRTTDTSLAGFVEAHFGREIVDYALNPFVGGIYAGDPEKLSAHYAFPNLWQLERQYGSLLRGLRTLREETGTAPVISFKNGLQTLPATLAAALPDGSVQTGAKVTSLIPGKPWKLIWTRTEAVETAEFDAVVLALPASGLAQMAFNLTGECPLASLEQQPHPPVSSLFLGFRREQVAHPLDGFGALVPALERRSLLGVLFSSSLFANRTPEGHVALTVFAGGMRQPETARLPATELIASILPDLRTLLGLSGEPVFAHHTFWPQAIPQYNLGHERFLESLAGCESQYPGFFIGGHVRDGISLPDCVKSGAELARKTGEFLR